ncbi:GlmU family protein [Eisenibacter elegans]|uniref:GlmU family protein n=1 Tax=Eisenibacter elegans TaxID=997 RepID=UPI0004182C64|nr:GlmU family protein [Eisenibacter elegans]
MPKPYFLIDTPSLHEQLKPLSFTRAIADLRIGIDTIAEKWTQLWGAEPLYLTVPYLQHKYPAYSLDEANIAIVGSLLPTPELVQAIAALEVGQGLAYDDTLLACCLPAEEFQYPLQPLTFDILPYPHPPTLIRYPWELFLYNGAVIQQDYQRLTQGRSGVPLTDPLTRGYQLDQVFLEEGAQVQAAILNASQGPIYIGKNAHIQEGAIIQGPVAIGEGAVVNIGAKIRPNTTIGPYCKVGGEVSNSIFWGYSNKGHEGFLGNAVLGQWCNLGADTNNSNLKNNYSTVKVWSYAEQDFQDTGLQFCGLLMGDHAKAGINTMFNTGTVVGVSANVFGGGFPPKHVPSFAWGGAEGFEVYELDKAIETAERVMERRQIKLSHTERAILQYLYQQETSYEH